MAGRLIIISSPSGGGKGTLIREVRTVMPELAYSVSFTTRARRAGEEEGREYHFVTREKFDELIQADEFLEHAEVHGNMYGTSRAASLEQTAAGRDMIVEIDVQGAVQIMENSAMDCVSIFILPPSFEVLRERLTARGTEGEAELSTRLRNAFNEVLHYPKFKYVVVNEELRTATSQITSIITAERLLQNRQSEAVKAILDSFDALKHQYWT